MRFPDGKPLGLGAAIRSKLESAGIRVTPGLSPTSKSMYDEIADSIDDCDVFVVFGTEDYGIDTGNPMCSNKEFQFAKTEGKTIGHIKMCDKIRTATIRMGLANYLYRDQSEGVDALADWIIGLLSG